MPHTAADLVGAWKKSEGSSEDAAQYPDRIRFLDGSIYLVPPEERERKASLWQSGDYEVLEGGRIKIQTANDAMRTYSFSVSEKGVLSFEDEKGTHWEYERDEAAE